MQTLKCVKEYQMCGSKIPVGTIMEEIPSKIGSSSYKDKNGTIYTFDNSEIVFSPEFHASFSLVSKD